MYVVKALSFLFLGLYLLVVGLQALGVVLGFVTPSVLGFLALVAGVLFLVRGVKNYFHECKSCDRTPYDKPKV